MSASEAVKRVFRKWEASLTTKDQSDFSNRVLNIPSEKDETICGLYFRSVFEGVLGVLRATGYNVLLSLTNSVRVGRMDSQICDRRRRWLGRHVSSIPV
jgi:hypothetical protein